MRGLWRGLALLASDTAGLGAKLGAVAKQIQNSNLYNNIALGKIAGMTRLDLVDQPDPTALDKMADLLRPYGLILAAYELAEVNRLLLKLGTPYQDLKDYWDGLGSVGADNRYHNEFMEAVGGLLVDGATRTQFVAGQDLTRWFPSVIPTQQSGLRTALGPGTKSNGAAVSFDQRSWNGGACGSIAASWTGSQWIHLNA